MSIFILSVISIPLLSFLLIQNNKIQNYVAGGIASKLSKTLGTKVSIENVSMDFLNRVVLKKMLIEDLKKDTLLYSPKTTISIKNLSFSKKNARIDRVELTEASINFRIDSLKTLNLQFIINKLSGDTAQNKKGWNVAFNNIGLIDSKFTLKSHNHNKVDSGISFADIGLTSMNLRIKNFETENHTTSFRINRLSFIEKSGFKLENLTSKVKLNKGFMHYDNLRIFTPMSTIDAPKVYFDFEKFRDFSEFAQKVKLQISFNSSTATIKDVSYFAKTFWGMHENFKFSGNFKGPLSDLRCKNLFISYNQSSFSGDISFTGLPVIKETYIFIDSKKLKILVSDVESIYLPKLPDKRLILPAVLKKVGSVSYKGKFTGFINDFVAYGSLKTDLGEIKSDFLLKPESKTSIVFKGKIAAVKFNVGKFLEKENIVGFANINLEGTGFIEENKKVTGIFDGKINQFDFNKYTFADIEFKGSLKENAFKGSFSLDDPNVKLNLLGRFDFSKKIPEFDFDAKLDNARLYALNLVKKDSVFDVSCALSAKFKGNNINNSEGNIYISNFGVKKGNRTLNVNGISIFSQYNDLKIISEIVNISVEGKYDLKSIIPSMANAFKIYMPSGFYKIKSKSKKETNNFKFAAILKNPKPIIDFLAPGKSIANNTIVSGSFFPSDSIFKLELKSDYIEFGKARIDGLNLGFTGNHDSLYSLIKTEKISIGETIKFKRFEAVSKAKKDSLNTSLAWLISDTADVISKMDFYANFRKDELGTSPYLKIKLLPTEISVIDSIWKFNESEIRIDTSSLSVINLTVAHKNQTMNIRGKISDNKEDTMRFAFSNFDLNNIGFLINSNKFKFNGTLKGSADLVDFFHNTQIVSRLKINRFTFNNEILGDTYIEARWDNSQQKILVAADSYKKEKHTLNVSGNYIPSSKAFDFSAELNGINLHVLQPYLSTIFLIKKGTGTGKITLTGIGSKPVLNGEVSINEGNLAITYLNTIYELNSSIKIENNKFIFNNIKLADQNKNNCTLNGTISNTYFKDFNVNLSIDLKNNLVLNTRQVNNQSYYGKVFASGKVNITGIAPDIYIEVTQARTEKNSILYIPIDNKNDLIETRILTFKPKGEALNKEENVQNAVAKSSLKLKMDFEITPEAEVQLIFDPKIGDLIKSSGTGNLIVEVNPVSGFSMRGDYTIQSGDYLFTLQNLINKKFLLQNGGVISWNGNPMDANIDLKAVYRLRASVYNLFTKEIAETSKESKELSDLKKSIPIECVIFLKGKLMNPDIKPEITLPNATEETKDKVREAINNEEELNKQFFMLLVTNSFYSDVSSDAQVGTNSGIGRELATTTSYEMLSNQFSNWVSQLSKDFDFAFKYRPEKDITTQELEIALSTQILNDRVSINGNLDVGGTNQTTKNTNKLVGDVNVDVKLTENGKLMFKAFNRSNERVIHENPYTQGIGLLYREEFINFAELTRRYYQKLFGRKNDEPKVPFRPAEKDTSSGNTN